MFSILCPWGVRGAFVPGGEGAREWWGGGGGLLSLGGEGAREW